jgi:putative FmdB family regulatory protein
MPLYEYQCTACAQRTEVLQRFDDAPLAACPACGGAVKKLVSSPAFQFKGSGWYVTDYARSSNRGAEKSDAGGDSDKSDSKAETKTDAKTETKTASESKEKKKVAKEK